MSRDVAPQRVPCLRLYCWDHRAGAAGSHSEVSRSAQRHRTAKQHHCNGDLPHCIARDSDIRVDRRRSYPCIDARLPVSSCTASAWATRALSPSVPFVPLCRWHIPTVLTACEFEWLAGRFFGEVSDFVMSYSGNSLMSAFTLRQSANELVGLVYDLGQGAFIDAMTSSDQLASVGAVPEPEAWAMLLAGLGFLGFSVKGRQNRV